MYTDDGKTYIVTDIETNGKKLPYGRIIEIALIKICNGELVDFYQQLVNPKEPIPWFISNLTGIKNSMTKKAPIFKDIAKDIVNFIEDGIIVAHNAPFDYSYLKFEIERSINGFCFENEKICTVRLARKKYPQLGKYNLDFLSDVFNIKNPHRHRAYGDAMVTAELFVKYLII